MPDPLPIRMLIVSDQQSLTHLCTSVGSGMGLICLRAESVEQALAQIGSDAPELVLAAMSSESMELLSELKKHSPQTELALLTVPGTPENPLEAMRLGAYVFAADPLREENLRLILERLVEKVHLVRENEDLRERLRGRLHPGVQLETDPGTALPVCTDLEELERLTVQRVFEHVNGDKEQAQKLLGISRATLYRKIKRYGIQTRPARQDAELVPDAANPVILLSQS